MAQWTYTGPGSSIKLTQSISFLHLTFRNQNNKHVERRTIPKEIPY